VTRQPLDVREALPEIDLIEDAELRERVAAVWQQLWSDSSFAALEDVPIGPELAPTHLPHNRSVVTMALQVAETLERFHGIVLDRDVLVAAGLLQDVSKLVEMEPGAEGAVATELGRNFQHAFWAAHKALEQGIPMRICEIVLNHTPQSPRFPSSLEGKVLWYLDQLDLLALSGELWSKRLYLSR
jgi:hypothetical protein